MQKEDKTWYASWFNSPYYHILYKERDHSEAADFMQTLTTFLSLNKDSKILDLACGKGRHSKFLATLGYQVTGVDLSEESILHAKQFEKVNLIFKVHDMCLPYPDTFDAVFNLFTSFGYFETEEDNLRTIKAIKSELNPNGLGVIDFLNTNFVAANLVHKETKIVEGIHFEISREITNGFILKTIRFTHTMQDFKFKEKVRAFTIEDLKWLLKEAGLKLKHTFGDYQLNNFDISTSERLILIFGK